MNGKRLEESPEKGDETVVRMGAFREIVRGAVQTDKSRGMMAVSSERRPFSSCFIRLPKSVVSGYIAYSRN